MNPARFDALSQELAVRVSRRRALHPLVGRGLLASLLGAVGLRPLRAAAQDDDMGVLTCVLVVEASVATGPDRGLTVAGDLAIRVQTDGSVDTGTLDDVDGKRHAVSGQVIGRVANLRVTVGDGQFLALTGVAEGEIRRCEGRIDGTFGGPRRNDLGTWSAVPRRRGG